MNSKDYYTAGQLAKLSGTTYKSIRVYVEKGLLVPEQISETGYKYFSKYSVERLQRVLMFKYLDFSLEEIRQLLDEEDISEPLDRQRDLIEQKINHLKQVKKAVNEMKKLSGEDKWDKMLEIMKLTSQKEELINQYTGSKNLEARINIHKYSTSVVEWFDFLVEKCEFEEGMNILDVGCGNGMLWIKEKDILPDNLEIYMVDNSKAMIDAAKSLLEAENEFFKKKGITFHYAVCEAAKIDELKQIEGIKFKRILANHMLYHIDDTDRKTFLKKANDKLTPNGKFIASTIGDDHMKELWELARMYDKKVNIPQWFSEGFTLENGKKQLEDIFAEVTLYYHDDNLIVPDWKAIYDYMCSLPGGIEKIIKNSKTECEKYLKSRVTKNTPFFITKSTGVFVAKKQF